MSFSLNRIEIIGILGKDAETRLKAEQSAFIKAFEILEGKI